MLVTRLQIVSLLNRKIFQAGRQNYIYFQAMKSTNIRGSYKMAPSKKFGRNYILQVETSAGTTITIKLPFTVEFDITRNVMTSANVASIRIYNLNANHRAQIRKNITDYQDIRTIELKAGYGDTLAILFSGNITQAWSVREGTNFITQIESFDGGFAFANSVSDITATSGTTQKSVIDTLFLDLKKAGVKPGVIGSFPGSLTRGNAYSGSTTQILQDLSGGRFYIDNGKAYVLADNECLSGPVTLINAASGLLNTPLREQTIINFDMLFEPKLVIGQLVELDSSTTDDQNVNGKYKVISLKHRGMISAAVCGDAITSVGLLQPKGSQGLTVVGAA